MVIIERGQKAKILKRVQPPRTMQWKQGMGNFQSVWKRLVDKYMNTGIVSFDIENDYKNNVKALEFKQEEEQSKKVEKYKILMEKLAKTDSKTEKVIETNKTDEIKALIPINPINSIAPIASIAPVTPIAPIAPITSDIPVIASSIDSNNVKNEVNINPLKQENILPTPLLLTNTPIIEEDININKHINPIKPINPIKIVDKNLLKKIKKYKELKKEMAEWGSITADSIKI
jgi:hypothetical protein